MKLFTILLIIFLSNTYAASVREGSVEVELVSSVTCVSPGETTLLLELNTTRDGTPIGKALE